MAEILFHTAGQKSVKRIHQTRAVNSHNSSVRQYEHLNGKNYPVSVAFLSRTVGRIWQTNAGSVSE